MRQPFSPETYAPFREIVRLRAFGLTRSDIARRLHVDRNHVTKCLEHPEGVARLAAMQDAMDAEVVRSMVYCPWVELLANAGTQKRRRRVSLSD